MTEEKRPVELIFYSVLQGIVQIGSMAILLRIFGQTFFTSAVISGGMGVLCWYCAMTSAGESIGGNESVVRLYCGRLGLFP